MKKADRTTRRPRAQEVLRESEARFRALAESAPLVIWMTGPNSHCTYISKYWNEFTGRHPEKDLGFGWIEALHPEDRDRAARDLIEASRSRRACQGEYRVRRANGKYGWLYVYSVPYLHADGSYAGHIGTFTDVTLRKNREKAGFEIQNSLLLGQEAERKRVARELHDDISQRLALVGIALNEVEQLLPAAPQTLEDKLRALRQHVESIALDIHRISHNLHPSTLVHLGLVSALHRLCRDVADQTHIAVHFTGDVASPQMSQEVEITLYRITQECLANVGRHSGSREASVALIERSGVLYLTISDTGVGFDTQRLPAAAGLGLVSIRERARMIGADVQITSAPSRGTMIELRVPLAVVGSADQLSSERLPPTGV